MEIPIAAVTAPGFAGESAANFAGGASKLAIRWRRIGDKIPHHMNDRPIHSEQVGIKISLRDAIPSLPAQPRVELIFRDRFQNGPLIIRPRRFRIDAPY